MNYTSVSARLLNFFNAVLLLCFIELLIVSGIYLFKRYELVNGKEFFLNFEMRCDSSMYVTLELDLLPTTPSDVCYTQTEQTFNVTTLRRYFNFRPLS